jgi:hypothetical protein
MDIPLCAHCGECDEFMILDDAHAFVEWAYRHRYGQSNEHKGVEVKPL